MPTVLERSSLRIIRKLYLRHQRFATALCQSLRNSSGALLKNTTESYYALFGTISPTPSLSRLFAGESMIYPLPSTPGLSGADGLLKLWTFGTGFNHQDLLTWLKRYSTSSSSSIHNSAHQRFQFSGGDGIILPPGLSLNARKFHTHTRASCPAALTNTPSAKGLGADEDNKTDYTKSFSAAGNSSTSSKSAYEIYGSGGGGGNQWSSYSKKSKPTSYMFSHSAAGIPKNASKIPINQGNTVLDDSGEPELSTGSGEDAFFHRSDAMGVADGVGGWAGDSKANAGLFARRLMHHAHEEIARFDDFDDEMFVRYAEASPVEILRQAYENTLEDFRSLDLKGSSTACIVLLRDDELRVANLGDCGLTVVRHGDMIFRTEEQQHSFNFPYQLGTGKHSDKPTDAQIFRLKVRKGDIIIVGSDGLFDNLFDEDILEEVNRLLPPVYRAEGGPKLKVHYSDDAARSHSLAESTAEGEDDVDGGSSSRNTKFSDAIDKKASAPAVAPDPHQARARLGFSLPQFHIDPKAISDAIAYRAKYVSEESRYVSSPFQTRAIQEGLYYQGGKKDDISVVVAIITDLEDSPDRRL